MELGINILSRELLPFKKQEEWRGRAQSSPLAALGAPDVNLKLSKNVFFLNIHLQPLLPSHTFGERPRLC